MQKQVSNKYSRCFNCPTSYHFQQTNMTNIPFQAINWSTVEKVTYPGETGTAIWQTIQHNGLRVRMVEYSSNYLADHWCQKGHIVYCLKGSFVSELENEAAITLTEGMSYIVSDDLSSHRSISKEGCQLLIIDGDFLKTN